MCASRKTLGGEHRWRRGEMYNARKFYNSGDSYNQAIGYIAPAWYTHPAHAVPAIVDEQFRPLELLAKAHNIATRETLAREHTVTLTIPYDPASLVLPGALVELAGVIYRIATIDSADDEGGRTLTVEAWALWNDLAKARKIEGRAWVTVTAEEMLGWLVFLTPWRVGTSLVTQRRSFSWQGGCNRLDAIRQVETLYNAEIVWDTVERTVSIVPEGGVDRGLYFLRYRNLRAIDIQASSVDTIYRLYPKGRAGLGIESVNRGLDYVEVPAPEVPMAQSPPPSDTLVDERFVDPQELLEYATAILAARSGPRMTYECDVVDISAADSSEVDIRVGDIVTVYDETMDLTLKTRVISMEYNVAEPWLSKIELSTVTLGTSNILKQLLDDKAMADKRQFAPHNTLLQSVDFHTGGMVTRYEDATRYLWTFTADAQGRITRLTNVDHAQHIDIRWLGTELPPS